MLQNLSTSVGNILASTPGNSVDKGIIDYFNNLFDGNGWGNFILMMISLFTTVILVGIIGYQREAQGHNAGFRTHILVGVGSCMITMLSINAIGYVGPSGTGYETMRLAASIAPGIGFIGAGVIIKNRTSIKGLTTASTLWVSMAIGMCCGAGNFTIAVLGSISVYFTLFVLYRVETYTAKNSSRLIINFEKDSLITYKDIQEVLIVYQYNIRHSSISNVTLDGVETIEYTIEFNNIYKEPLELMCRDIKIKLNPIRTTYELKHKSRQKVSE
ncbi:MAG: MgtC/SapB family protein [bacterium]|nr:MgtC/SapB family protein [bacterium]